MPEIKIYEDIGEDWFGDGVSAKKISDQLAGMTGDLTVRINSLGGDVFEGHAIYNLIKGYKGKTTVIVDGIAASAASVIAMAGDDVILPVNGMLMIHDPWTFAMGDARVMNKTAETLNSIKQSIVNVYEEKTGLDSKQISDMMEDETWLDVDQAVELGFASKDDSNSAVLNKVESKQWINKAPKIAAHVPSTAPPKVERSAANDSQPEDKEEPKKASKFANQEARKRFLEIMAEAI